jgi:hypothetical protein
MAVVASTFMIPRMLPVDEVVVRIGVNGGGVGRRRVTCRRFDRRDEALTIDPYDADALCGQANMGFLIALGCDQARDPERPP